MNILNNNALGATDTRTALQNANMDWNVSKRNLYTASGEVIPRNYGTFRDDKTGADGFLGVVGEKYEIMQNEAAFGILDDMILADDSRNTIYSTVGELSGGRQVYASVDLRKSFDVVPGDTHTNYVVATTSHDGSTATKLFLTTVRVICRNTLQAGIQQAKAKGEIAAIKHTSASHDRLAVARRQLVNAGYTIDLLKGKLQELSTRQITRESISNILDRLFPMPKATENGGASVTRTENKRAAFLELFERNDGRGGFSLVKGTAYNAYNAFTEYTDHFAVAKQTAQKQAMDIDAIRAENSFFGAGAIQKGNALEIILEATQFAPVKSQPMVIYPTMDNRSVLESILNAN